MAKEDKVVIGIVAKHIKSKNIRINSLIRDEVKQAVFDNGAIPMGILSPSEEVKYNAKDYEKVLNEEDKENILREIKLCDGIILQGGLTNEAAETFIARYAYDNDIPILGICAGQNIIAYALGGSIFKIPNPEKHNVEDTYVHEIKINKESLFYKIIGKESIMVNSRHNNSVKECSSLEKVAFCDDGYPDVIESKNKRFYVGVRFHPESLYKTDENMNKIFKYFIEKCEERHGSK